MSTERTRTSIATSSPTLTGDGGLVYGANGTLTCLSATNGSVLWRYPTGGAVASSPAVRGDGAIVFGCDDGYLYALTPGGALLWRLALGAAVSTSPAVAPDGTAVVSAGTSIIAVSADGAELWRYAVTVAGTSPSLGPDGTVFVGGDDYVVHAIWPNGTQRWARPAGGTVAFPPAVAADGVAYVRAGHAVLAFCLTALSSGSRNWRMVSCHRWWWPRAPAFCTRPEPPACSPSDRTALCCGPST
jgi:outer membrane protein assembly factor BamB